jgi:hypothetical protein
MNQENDMTTFGMKIPKEVKRVLWALARKENRSASNWVASQVMSAWNDLPKEVRDDLLRQAEQH